MDEKTLLPEDRMLLLNNKIKDPILAIESFEKVVAKNDTHNLNIIQNLKNAHSKLLKIQNLNDNKRKVNGIIDIINLFLKLNLLSENHTIFLIDVKRFLESEFINPNTKKSSLMKKY